MKAALGALALLSGWAVPAYAQVSASDYTSAARYDLEGRVTGTIAPDPDASGALKYAAVRNTYNAQGLLTKVETGELAAWQADTVAPSAWTGFTVLASTETQYDLAGRKLRVTVKGSDLVATAVTQYSYDAAGALECTAVRMNPAVYGSLPASACTLGTTGTQGPDRITRNVYNSKGQLEKVQKAVGTTLQQDYVTYSYTANGKQASVTDANGTKATYVYDMLDRLARWNFASKTTAGISSPTDYEEYGYDANGNRTSLRKRDGRTLTYQYDALNRNKVKIVPDCVSPCTGLAATHTRDVYYVYDLRGLQLSARFDSISGEGLVTAYDNLGRPTSSTLTMDGVARVLQYGFDNNGNRTSLTQPSVATTSFNYDGLDRMAAVLEGTTVNVATFTYNQRGQRASLTQTSGGATSYGYDPVGRLASVGDDLAGTAADTTSTFTYNPASQIVVRTRSNDSYVYGGDVARTLRYTANGLNQYATVGAATYAYDANGNLTNDGATTYTYDVENRLVSASGVMNATLRYDPLGRLYETVGGGVTTRFLYDGDELVAEYNGAGTLQKRYVHGAGADDPLLWYEGAARRQLYTDHQGSIVSVADASGTSIQINRYDDWGVPQSGNVGRFQYTGQAWIPELGMYYYKARIYSPRLGRFMQTDPIGYEDQQNLYVYVGNDPVNGTDPTGLTERKERNTDRGLTMDGCNGARASSSCSGTQGVTGVPDAALKALNANNAYGYWQNSPDNPMADVGKGADLTKEGGVLGALAKDRLLGYLMHKMGITPGYNEHGVKIPAQGDMTAVYRVYNAIRMDLAREDAAAIAGDRSGIPHLLSATQITEYHWKVFDTWGVSRSVFGGTPFTGTMFDVKITNAVWCGACDNE